MLDFKTRKQSGLNVNIFIPHLVLCKKESQDSHESTCNRVSSKIQTSPGDQAVYTFPGSFLCISRGLEYRKFRAPSLVVSDLRSETKVSRLESGC